jgi:hypothetical protein
MTPLRGQLSLFDQPAAPAEDGPPCLACGHKNTVVSPGVGPHHARIDCPKCRAWRWQPKPRPSATSDDTRLSADASNRDAGNTVASNAIRTAQPMQSKREVSP